MASHDALFESDIVPRSLAAGLCVCVSGAYLSAFRQSNRKKFEDLGSGGKTLDSRQQDTQGQ